LNNVTVRRDCSHLGEAWEGRDYEDTVTARKAPLHRSAKEERNLPLTSTKMKAKPPPLREKNEKEKRRIGTFIGERKLGKTRMINIQKQQRYGSTVRHEVHDFTLKKPNGKRAKAQIQRIAQEKTGMPAYKSRKKGKLRSHTGSSCGENQRGSCISCVRSRHGVGTSQKIKQQKPGHRGGAIAWPKIVGIPGRLDSWPETLPEKAG